MGHSAGCHLVMLAALDPKPLAQVGLSQSALRGVISWSGGAFDLVDKVHQGGMYAKYIRLTFGDDPGVWKDASPVTHVTDTKLTTPFLLVSAQNDHAASTTANEQMTSKIRRAGGHVQRVMLPGKTHRTADHDLGMPGDKTGDILLQFIHHPDGK
jgi:acetyl esterase/lipase